MAQVFGHEKLKVYQKGMDFVAIRGEFHHATILIVEQIAFWSTLLTRVVRGLRKTESSTWGTPMVLHLNAPRAWMFLLQRSCWLPAMYILAKPCWQRSSVS